MREGRSQGAKLNRRVRRGLKNSVVTKQQNFLKVFKPHHNCCYVLTTSLNKIDLGH